MRILLWTLTTLLLAPSVLAQTDWREFLNKDLVTIEGEKMIIEDVSLVSVDIDDRQPISLQVKTRSEAPLEGVLSRDNFVSLSSVMSYMIMIMSMEEAFQIPASTILQNYSSTSLDESIGRPDMELNMFMTNQGLQVEIVNTSTGQSNRFTQRWSELHN